MAEAGAGPGRETTRPLTRWKLVGLACFSIGLLTTALLFFLKADGEQGAASQPGILVLGLVNAAGLLYCLWLIATGRPRVVADSAGVEHEGLFGRRSWSWPELGELALDSTPLRIRLRDVHLYFLRAGPAKIGLVLTEEGRDRESAERFRARLAALRERRGSPGSSG